MAADIGLDVCWLVFLKKIGSRPVGGDTRTYNQHLRSRLTPLRHSIFGDLPTRLYETANVAAVSNRPRGFLTSHPIHSLPVPSPDNISFLTEHACRLPAVNVNLPNPVQQSRAVARTIASFYRWRSREVRCHSLHYENLRRA